MDGGGTMTVCIFKEGMNLCLHPGTGIWLSDWGTTICSAVLVGDETMNGAEM